MIYPQSFKEKCKVVHPNWKELHDALDEGSKIAGRYLDDARFSQITPQDVIASNNLLELKEKAENRMVKEDLYSEWLTLYHMQQEVINK